MSAPAVETARRLARALDHEDYAAAGDLIAAECTYRIGSETLIGPEAIIASYKGNGDWAKQAIDSIEYESAVREDGDQAVITYWDRLEHAGVGHTHVCEQRVQVDANGLVCAIEHRDLPGERETLDAFFSKVKIERESRK